MASLASICTGTGPPGVVGGARRPRAVSAPAEAAAAGEGAGCRRGVVEAGVVHRGGAARRRGLTRQRVAAGAAAEGRGVPRTGAATPFGLASSAAAAVGVSCRAAGSNSPSVGDGDVSKAAAAPGAAAAAAAAGKPPIPPLPLKGGADTRRIPTYHLHEDATDFDVIVVGAGHAGCEVGPRGRYCSPRHRMPHGLLRRDAPHLPQRLALTLHGARAPRISTHAAPLLLGATTPIVAPTTAPCPTLSWN